VVLHDDHTTSLIFGNELLSVLISGLLVVMGQHLLMGLVEDRYNPAFSDSHGKVAVRHGKRVVTRLRYYHLSLSLQHTRGSSLPETLGTSAYKPLGLAKSGFVSSVASRSTIPFLPSFDSWAVLMANSLPASLIGFSAVTARDDL
jgi:hypothetical protein